MDSLSTRSNGVPGISCSHERRHGGSDSSRRKSARTGRPRLVMKTCVQRSSATLSILRTPGHQRGKW